MLSIRDVSKTYANGVQALRGVSLDVPKGIIVSMLLLAAVPFGMLIGAQMPWLDPQTVGPVRPLAYVHAFIFYALPNLVIPTVTRSRLAAYTALVALLVLSAASSTLAGDLEYRSIAALLDPLAAIAFQELVRYRTPVELETELLAFEGLFLWNRLLWLAVAAVLLALTFRLISGPQCPLNIRMGG